MGKGDDRRPTQVSEAELSRNWARTFDDGARPDKLRKRCPDLTVGQMHRELGDRHAELWESYKNRPGSAAKFTWGEWIDLHGG